MAWAAARFSHHSYTPLAGVGQLEPGHKHLHPTTRPPAPGVSCLSLLHPLFFGISKHLCTESQGMAGARSPPRLREVGGNSALVRLRHSGVQSGLSVSYSGPCPCPVTLSLTDLHTLAYTATAELALPFPVPSSQSAKIIIRLSTSACLSWKVLRAAGGESRTTEP